MNELTKRILFAVPAAIIMLLLVWYGGWPFEILIAVIAGVTIWELHRILDQAGRPDFFLLSLLIAFIVWIYFHLPLWFIAAFSIVLLSITGWAFFDTKRSFSERWLSTFFTGIYPTVGFFMIVNIRNLGGNIEGFWLTVTLFLMIWGNDVFAYFGGKNFGKHKMVPAVSPNKTWEGFWSGFLGAAVGFLIVYLIANPFPLPLWSLIPAVIIVSVFGPLGDIIESSLKRKAGVKDSSSILPGHGGMFDRFDSIILSAPVLFFFYYFLI